MNGFATLGWPAAIAIAAIALSVALAFCAYVWGASKL